MGAYASNMAVRGIDYGKHFPTPPEFGTGSDFIIAQHYINGYWRDRTTRDAMGRAKTLAQQRGDEELDKLYRHYEDRLDRGDRHLAARLANQAQAEVVAVEAGDRLTTTGQYHLLPERSTVLRNLVSQAASVNPL